LRSFQPAEAFGLPALSRPLCGCRFNVLDRFSLRAPLQSPSTGRTRLSLGRTVIDLSPTITRNPEMRQKLLIVQIIKNRPGSYGGIADP
jgi:hypothetical protein